MADRLVAIEEPCEHGKTSIHTLWHFGQIGSCPGGFRRVLDPGEYVLVEKGDGGWPDWALKISSGTDIRSILDALAGGEQ